MKKIKSKIIEKAWLAALGDMSKDHIRFSHYLYRTLWNGDPVKLAEIEEHTSIPMRRLKKLVKKQPCTVFNDDHHIVRHAGLQLKNSEYEVISLENKIYASSAMDCLLLPHILNRPLELQVLCKNMEETSLLKLEPAGLETSVEGIYVTFPHPNHLNKESVASFEQTSYFIKGENANGEWLRDKTEIIAIPLAQGFQVAQAYAELVYRKKTKK